STASSGVSIIKPGSLRPLIGYPETKTPRMPMSTGSRTAVPYGRNLAAASSDEDEDDAALFPGPPVAHSRHGHRNGLYPTHPVIPWTGAGPRPIRASSDVPIRGPPSPAEKARYSGVGVGSALGNARGTDPARHPVH